MIARYSAVLEGNFIYWMTGAYLAAGSEEARSNILENLHEEVRDSHPRMLRTFTLAAHAIPTDHDAEAVHQGFDERPSIRGPALGGPDSRHDGFLRRVHSEILAYLADLAADKGRRSSNTRMCMESATSRTRKGFSDRSPLKWRSTRRSPAVTCSRE